MSHTRVALVTGANRGIGLEVCRQLAVKGLRVILTARDPAKARAAAASLGAAGDVVAATLDVTDLRGARHLADDLASRREHVDVLVNNAAVLVAESQGAIETPLDDIKRTFDTNVFGAISVSQAFAPAMVARKYGRIVNVSSQAGQLASMGTYAPAYSMSKSALNAFTRQLAAATKGTGVLANSASPGRLRTDIAGPGVSNAAD